MSLPPSRDEVERVGIGFEVDRMAKCVGLRIEIGNDFVPLDDVGPAIGKVQIVSVWIRRERGDRMPSQGSSNSYGKTGLVTSPIALFDTRSAKV